MLQRDSFSVNGNVTVLNSVGRQYRWLALGEIVPVMEIKGNVNFGGQFVVTSVQYKDRSLALFLCNAPNNPRATIVTTNSARLEWDFVPNASGYQIRGKRASNSSWTFIQIHNPNITHRDVFGLAQGFLYQWNILSLCDSAFTNSSEWSNHRIFTPDCYAPENIRTEMTSTNGARLSWSKVWGVAGYEIKGQRIGSSGIATIQVSYTDTVKDVFGLLPGSLYWWTVRSICNQMGTNYSDFAENDTFSTNTASRLGFDKENEFSGEPVNENHLFVANNTEKVFVKFYRPIPVKAVMNVHNVAGTVIARFNLFEGTTEFEFSSAHLSSILALVEFGFVEKKLRGEH